VSAASPAGEGASTERPSRTFRMVSASYQNKAYPEGVLRVNGTGNEIELRQWTGKKGTTDAAVARFNLEPNVAVVVDGPLLRVSELSIVLESPDVAGEVADLLRRPTDGGRYAVSVLSRAEASVSRFLEVREEALSALSRIRVDPRAALFDLRSVWTTDDTEPLDAVYAHYSMRLAESLEKMTSSIAGGEETLGPSITDRLYAIAYTVAAVQNALFEGKSDLAQELAALQEFGTVTTAQDLRMPKPTERLLLSAHQELVALATARVPN
jgi:hypothetical protein